MNATGISKHAFSNIKRPTTLYFDYQDNAIEYLDEQTFLPFFNENERNKVYYHRVKLDCNNCKNYWLINQPELKAKGQLDWMLCSDGSKLGDVKNFAQCNEFAKSCKYDQGGKTITCGGDSEIDLVQIFEKLGNTLNTTQKHFSYFYLKNTAITEIKANTFKDYSFQEIYIMNCNLLKSVHENAFNGTENETRHIEIRNNPKLQSEDNSIFKALTKFKNVEEIVLINNNITEIPSYAFKSNNTNQDSLKVIYLNGNSIKKIGKNAFSTLRNLVILTIYQTLIENIPEYAFEFDEPSDQAILININSNKLNSSGISKQAFANIRRPTTLYFDYQDNSIEYLDEETFLPFFKANEKNKVYYHRVKLDCNNCKNFWLTSQPQFKAKGQLDWMVCSDGRSLNDSNNFARCNDFSKSCKFDKIENAIYCSGNNNIDLKEIFGKFSETSEKNEKHFKKFHLNNTIIKVLEENIFNDLTFDEIIIENCMNLSTIHHDAFTTTSMVTKVIKIKNSALMSTQSNSIFRILSKFINLESVSLDNNNIKEIPSNAFQIIIGYQDNLKEINISGSSFMTIGVSAFENLHNLERITFSMVDLDKISNNAFRMTSSDKPMVIDFSLSPQINSSVFEVNTLAGIQRPTRLIFGSPDQLSHMTYLDEKVFLPFLLGNMKNTIELNLQMFDCNDCRNNWIGKHQALLPRFQNLICSNGKYLLDSTNFKNC